MEKRTEPKTAGGEGDKDEANSVNYRLNLKHSVASILAKPSKIIQVPWKVPKRGKKQRHETAR